MAEVAVDRRKFVIPDNYQALQIMGHQEEHLRAMEEQLGVHMLARGNEIGIDGPADRVAVAQELLEKITKLAAEGQPLASQDILYATRLAAEGHLEQLEDVYRDVILVTARGKPIKPKTLGQKRYLEAIRDNGMVFGIGPAGTGKTYLAMALAVDAFRNRQVNRIVLTRPAVEAGEKLGFLPGDLQEKVDPYLRPLYDALYDILGVDTFEKYMGRGMIEVAPLAYMRGRTLDDSFVILDEAQNTTPEQMKMFLTRLGFGSRAVVTGDVTQIDLPADATSGLQVVRRILRNVRGVSFVELTEKDVVRHPLVQAIIRAYDAYEKRHAGDVHTGV